uniref:Proline and serine rich 3 n=1 Tax=Pelodiscus sinensis TaxID=13735 RepID=K7FMX9_PELSI
FACSASLFSIQGSPFAVQSPARSHYHPSPIRPPGPQHQRMVRRGRARLGTSCQGTALDSDSTDPFPESWPSTERTSPDTPQETAALGQPLHPPASKQDRESIIAKYIERFRHGQPSSRSQRQMPPAHPNKEFWWLEPVPPSVSSTPKGRAKPGTPPPHRTVPGATSLLGSGHGLFPALCAQCLLDTTLLESPDADTHSLQERAAQLLWTNSLPSKLACSSCSESSLSSTVPVSSEGLRSTPPHSTPDLDQALPSPPQLSLPKPSSGPRCSSSTRPEDDILFQWRLRRKMEQASQGGSRMGVPPLTPAQAVLSAPMPGPSQHRLAGHRLLSSQAIPLPQPPSPLTPADQAGQGAASPPEQGTAAELPAPGSQHPQLLHLAAQLLEEAEESDGAEFEEDPLLQLLRGQRENLRSQ